MSVRASRERHSQASCGAGFVTHERQLCRCAQQSVSVGGSVPSKAAQSYLKTLVQRHTQLHCWRETTQCGVQRRTWSRGPMQRHDSLPLPRQRSPQTGTTSSGSSPAQNKAWKGRFGFIEWPGMTCTAGARRTHMAGMQQRKPAGAEPRQPARAPTCRVWEQRVGATQQQVVHLRWN